MYKPEWLLVDDVDSDLCTKKLKISENNYNSNRYCVYYENYELTSIHREIMERVLGRKLKPNEMVDHVNNNGLDNRRKNLRVCSHQQNQFNQKKRKNTSSVYKGVCWNKARKNWKAQIRFNYKLINLGYFKSEEDAALAYNKKAKELFGEFANLNKIGVEQ